MVLGVLTGWLGRREREAVAYLLEENCILRVHLSTRSAVELVVSLRVPGHRPAGRGSFGIDAMNHYRAVSRGLAGLIGGRTLLTSITAR